MSSYLNFWISIVTSWIGLAILAFIAVSFLIAIAERLRSPLVIEVATSHELDVTRRCTSEVLYHFHSDRHTYPSGVFAERPCDDDGHVRAVESVRLSLGSRAAISGVVSVAWRIGRLVGAPFGWVARVGLSMMSGSGAGMWTVNAPNQEVAERQAADLDRMHAASDRSTGVFVSRGIALVVAAMMLLVLGPILIAVVLLDGLMQLASRSTLEAHVTDEDGHRNVRVECRGIVGRGSTSAIDSMLRLVLGDADSEPVATAESLQPYPPKSEAERVELAEVARSVAPSLARGGAIDVRRFVWAVQSGNPVDLRTSAARGASALLTGTASMRRRKAFLPSAASTSIVPAWQYVMSAPDDRDAGYYARYLTRLDIDGDLRSAANRRAASAVSPATPNGWHPGPARPTPGSLLGWRSVDRARRRQRRGDTRPRGRLTYGRPIPGHAPVS